MRKQKWSDFFGALCATATVAGVVATANHMQKKYGVKSVSSLMDYKRIANYALDKFLFDNEKLLASIEEKINKVKVTETEKNNEQI